MRDLEPSHLIGRARLLRREGKTYNEIRAVIGDVEVDVLRGWLRGIPRPPETNRSGRGLPEVRRKARQLRAKGLTYAEIGRLTGASVGSLNLWLRDMPLDHFAPNERKVRRFQESCARSRTSRMAEREASIAAIAEAFGQTSEDQLRFRVSIHESADIRAAELHWSDVTGAGIGEFGRATLKRHNGRVRGRGV